MFWANHLSVEKKRLGRQWHTQWPGEPGSSPSPREGEQGQGRAEERPEWQRHPSPAGGLALDIRVPQGALGLVPALASSCLRLPAGALPALGLQSPFTQQYLFQEQTDGTSSVVQWCRVHLPMQGTQVQPLVQEAPTCCGATRPMCHND